MKKPLFRLLLDNLPPLTVTLFVLSVVGMNLLANKSIDLGVPWLALDCGILLSWLSFLTMDILTKRYGPREATFLAFLALVINLMMALLFFLSSIIPGVWSASFVPDGADLINSALDRTFAGTWYIILGSSAAFFVSAVINNFLNYGIGKLLAHRDGFSVFAIRSYLSTGIAQFSDNFLFALLVSRPFFGWSLLQCLTCALTGALLELLFEVFFSPIGYHTVKKFEERKVGQAYLEQREKNT